MSLFRRASLRVFARALLLIVSVMILSCATQPGAPTVRRDRRRTWGLAALASAALWAAAAFLIWSLT